MFSEAERLACLAELLVAQSLFTDYQKAMAFYTNVLQLSFLKL